MQEAPKKRPLEFRADSSHYWRKIKYAVSNWRWLTMFILGRFQWVRKLVVWFSRNKGTVLPAGSTLFPEVSVEEAVRGLRMDGYWKGFQLPQETVEAIIRFSNTHFCRDDQDAGCLFDYRQRTQTEEEQGRRILIGRYSEAETENECPAIVAVQNDPVLRRIVSEYFGRNPRTITHRMWWSFSSDETDTQALARSGQTYHYDLDDYRTASFFFYLTDVDQSKGPHVMVRGSHTRKKLRPLFSPYKSRKEADLVKFYGEHNFVELCGPAGFGFVEDLFCYHRGNPPRSGHRLVLQIGFTLNQFGKSGMS